MKKKDFNNLKQMQRIEYLLLKDKYVPKFFPLTISLLWLIIWITIIVIVLMHQISPEIIEPIYPRIFIPISQLHDLLVKLIVPFFIFEVILIFFNLYRKYKLDKEFKSR